MSLDRGKSFVVIHSYVGGCPSGQESSFGFQLPTDTPASDEALFAWTWQNKVGNKEMYMNCAVVKIHGGDDGDGGAEKALFADRPAIFEANIGNGCGTVSNRNVKYPNTGPDVDVNDSAAVPPTGKCEAAAPTGSLGGSGNTDGSSGGGFATGPSAAMSTAVVPEPSGSAGAGGSGSGSGAGDDSASDSGAGSDGFEPGDDWPEGFSRAGRNAAGRVVTVIAGALAIGIMLY